MMRTDEGNQVPGKTGDSGVQVSRDTKACARLKFEQIKAQPFVFQSSALLDHLDE